MGIFKRLAWFFKREKKRYLIGVLALVVTDIVVLIPARVIGVLADEMNRRVLTSSSLIFWLGLLIFSAVSQYICRNIWRMAIWGGAATLERDLRSRLFQHFLKMDKTFFQRHRTGDLMAHATNDINAVQNVAGIGVLTFVDSVITGIFTIIAMIIFVDWRLTIIALIPLPLIIFFANAIGKRLDSAFSESQAAFSRLNNKAQESISGIKVIKAFGQRQEDIEDFNQLVDRTITINKRVNKLDAMFDPMASLVIGVTYVITILYGGTMVSRQVITLGQLISFVAYIGTLIWPMFAISQLFNIIERGSASYTRVMSLLNEKSLIVENPQAIVQTAHGDISYNVQRFSYPDDPTNPQLEHIQFELPQGKTLGLVGRVGAGKTTLIKLLMREFDSYQGDISIGGHNIKDYQLKALLDAIGYVPQDNFLFSTSIRNNIKFADYQTDEEEIEEAAKKSAIHDDILHFQEGYSTLVGEKGVSLSGGQKQRLSISRALLTMPEILILDDALSAVDAKTEESILAMLKNERQDKTTIIASHRLSSVMTADEILVLDDGQVKERGTHASLLARQGWYAQMWEQQQAEQPHHHINGEVTE